MREIKFRAWDKSRLEMVDDVRVHGMLNVKLKEPNLIFQQFTGLQDKNGVDIYEGDIVEYWDGTLIANKNGDIPCKNGSPMRYSVSPNVKREVIFNKCAFRVKNGNPLDSKNIGQSDIKVIGNIHQTPELIPTDNPD